MEAARMKRPYLLWKRGRTWYYKLPEGKHYLSTGQGTRSAAEQFVIELIHQERGSVPRYYSFRRYAEPFFVWDRCLHVRRLREEGKSITRRHAKIQRIRLEKHVLPDPFSSKQLSKITGADVLELRSRMLERSAPATVNKALGVVKVIFREALYLEEINRDPTTLRPLARCSGRHLLLPGCRDRPTPGGDSGASLAALRLRPAGCGRVRGMEGRAGNGAAQMGPSAGGAYFFKNDPQAVPAAGRIGPYHP
jgi:hypothetical protein